MFIISSADSRGVSPGGERRISTANRIPGGASTAASGEANDVVSGRSHDRQRATLTSATGQLHDRLRAVSRDRCQLLPDFRYRAVMDNGIVENEICPVFLARVPAGVTVTPDSSEVADHRWVSPAEFRALIAAGEVPVSPWAVLQMQRLAGDDDWAAAASVPAPTS
jgi:isopentenyldiphosphate isomerase